MKNNVVQFIALAFAVVLAAALQDMSPALGGVKPPLAASLVAFAALRLSLTAALVTGFALGTLLDALSAVSAFGSAVSLPLVASGAYFLRGSLKELPDAVAVMLVAAVAAPFGEVWLAVNGSAVGDAGLLVRLVAATTLAFPLGAGVGALLQCVWRHAGLETTETVQ